jgi:hypothetical protein
LDDTEVLRRDRDGRWYVEPYCPGGPPLLLRETPEALPFPLAVLPESLQRYCREVAKSKLAPVDFVGVPMLVVGGAAMGQSVNLRLKRDWVEPPQLWATTVGKSGKTKSPPMAAVTKPLLAIHEELKKESRRRQREWKEEAKKEGVHAPRPPLLQAMVQDSTREAPIGILRENPAVSCATRTS